MECISRVKRDGIEYSTMLKMNKMKTVVVFVMDSICKMTKKLTTRQKNAKKLKSIKQDILHKY